jgi:hypothetical protein
LDPSSGLYDGIPLKNSLKEMNEFYNVCKEDLNNENITIQLHCGEKLKHQATQLQLGSQSPWIEKSKEAH